MRRSVMMNTSSRPAIVYDSAYILTVTAIEIPVEPRHGRRFCWQEVHEYVNGEFVVIEELPGKPGRVMAVRRFGGGEETELNPLASTYAQRRIYGHALIMDADQYEGGEEKKLACW